MVRPPGGGSVLAGSKYGLNWASVGTIALVDLAYTLNGTDWISIADSVPNPGTFAWTVPDIETNDVRIRISETNGSLESISDPFSIVNEYPCCNADLDGDCDVDFRDFADFASYWLNSNCIGPDSCGGVDFDQSRRVDMNDLAVLLACWL